MPDALPLSDTVVVADQEQLAASVTEAYATDTAIFPIGGGTSLDFGLPAQRPGIGLSLGQLANIVDYPARDMTVTVEAGITMASLAETLITEGQWLPIDVPQSELATLGGVVATDFSGSRRYGSGTMRDYVIGIRAIDGTGQLFNAGGRVVKNVAGYDFCKLLTGSVGTLGIITQITLKLKPVPESSMLMTCNVSDLNEAERLLAALVHSQTTPAAVEILMGPSWQGDPALSEVWDDAAAPLLVVGLEGTEPEVKWMNGQLASEWRELSAPRHTDIVGQQAQALWKLLAEFPQVGQPPMVLKASVVPSGTTRWIDAVCSCDANCSIQAHAGNGVSIVQLSEFPSDGVTRMLIGQLRPAAAAHAGHVVVLSNTAATDMTHHGYWGAIHVPFDLMNGIKSRFDPKGILNPGRFVFT